MAVPTKAVVVISWVCLFLGPSRTGPPILELSFSFGFSCKTAKRHHQKRHTPGFMGDRKQGFFFEVTHGEFHGAAVSIEANSSDYAQ